MEGTVPRNKYRDIDRARIKYKIASTAEWPPPNCGADCWSLLSKTDRAMEQDLQNTHRRSRSPQSQNVKRLDALKECIASKAHLLRKGGETPHCQHRPSLHPSHRQR